jgi:aminobenzoyl-glutamate utilization protein B
MKGTVALPSKGKTPAIALWGDDVLADVGAIAGANAAEYDRIALDIWEHPEPSYEEVRSSAVYRDRLESQGFRVSPCPEMDHSFIAEKGSGGPVIAYMGEYDALPGMSQACVAERKPAAESSPAGAPAGAPGHACGHNLLGAGSLAAAETLAALLEKRGLPGRVRYYGCPAEEALGRIPLVKAGRFADADAVMTWHPADVNTPHRYTTNANLSVVFSFTGRASHAGMAPQAGRSALDAAQLFNMSMEFMREHLDKGILLHYVITDGGKRPNIVPETAATWLYVRAPKAEIIRKVMKRLEKAARGACLMTETSFTRQIKAGKCDYKPNDVIQDILLAAMETLPLPEPEEGELQFARALQATVDKADRPATLDPIGAPRALLKFPLHGEVGDFGAGCRIGGSLDTGDVSYVAPTGQMNSATWPLGVGAHTWQSCAASGSPWARKAMRWAGTTMALAGYLLATRPELLAKAASEHRSTFEPYRSTMDL